jgi:uncharacterized protein YegL
MQVANATKEGKHMPKKKKNFVALVLDASSSMNSCQRQAEICFKDIARRLESDKDQTTYVSLYTFDTYVKHHAARLDAGSVQYKDFLAKFRYYPSGQTAMFDAVGEASEELGNADIKANDDVSFLVMVFTDGEENASLRWNVNRIKKLIAENQKTDRWTYVFNVPPGHKQELIRMGVPADNVREWDAANAESVRETATVTTNAMEDFYRQRAAGVKAVRSFYTTDLSAIDPTVLKKQLKNVSRNFTAIPVGKEEPIADFVSRHNGGHYEIGTAYYQLTKPEIIQRDKDILIAEKGKKTIYGGDAARTLIGLGHVDTKVTPGNHSNYDIFVQSTSPNRKLVRGSRLLLRKS